MTGRDDEITFVLVGVAMVLLIAAFFGVVWIIEALA